MTTTLLPIAGGSITDPDSATASERALDTEWTPDYSTGFVWVHNATDDTAYLVTEDDATTDGRGVPAGATAKLGPYPRGHALWIYGLGTGSVHYSFDLTQSEG